MVTFERLTLFIPLLEEDKEPALDELNPVILDVIP